MRIFRRPIKANVDTVNSSVKASVCKNNLQLIDNSHYVPTGFVDSENSSGNIISGEWRNIVEEEDGALRRLTH